MGPDAMIFVFCMLSFKPTFSLSTFTFIKRLLSSSSLSAIRVVSSAYLRLLIFLPGRWVIVVQSLGRVQLCWDPMDGICQGPLSMGCSRQEHWSGLPLPSPQCIIFKDLIQVIREWFNGFRYILQFKSEFGNKEFVIWAKVSSWSFFFFFFFWLYRASPSLAANNIIDLISVFHTAHGVLKARVLKWFAIPFSSGPHSVRRLHPDPPVFGGPTHHDLVSVS